MELKTIFFLVDEEALEK